MGLGVVGLLVFVLVAMMVILPSEVERRVQERVSARGLAFSAEAVRVGLGGVTFDGVAVRKKAAGAPLFSATKVAVELSWWRAGDGARAIEQVVIERAQLDAQLSDIVELRRAKRAPSSVGVVTDAPKPPRVEVRELSARLRDAHGVLLAVDGVRASSDGQVWSAQAAKVELGAAPSDAVQIGGVSASGNIVESRPVLQRASASDGLLRWAPEGASEAVPTTLSRVLAFRDALRSTKTGSSDEGATGARTLWAADARLELKNTRVLDTDAQGKQRAVLENLAMDVQLEADHALRLEGQGRAPDSGSLSWKLRAFPKELRVEGHVALHDVSAALFAPVLPRLPFYELEHTRVRAELDLAGGGLQSVAVQGDLTLTDLTFYSEGLARTPVGPFSLSAKGQGTWTPARRELAITQGTLDVGGVPIALKGVFAWPTGAYRVELDAQLAKRPCAQVLAAVPAGLLDELAGVQLGGDVAGKLFVHVDAEDLDATKVDFDIDDHCSFAAVTPLLDLARFQQPFVHRALEPDGTVFEMETGPGTAAWTPIALISPFMVQAVIAHEDGRFLSHHGFAEPEIAVALTRNLKAHAFRFGASTITMQLVKNVFLHRDKLLARKVQEAFITWWLEQQWDKAHILELYLNVIEYGPAIYGIRNAAWHYFGTIPMNLTPAQSAFLAMVLPNPKVFHEHYDKGQLSSSMKNRTAAFLKHMHERQRIDDEALAYALEELEHFTFYDPDKPPPLAPPVRGSAQPLPFNVAVPGLDDWDTVQSPDAEDGSFGAP